MAHTCPSPFGCRVWHLPPTFLRVSRRVLQCLDGRIVVDHWSRTQATRALGTGERCDALGTGGAEGLRVQPPLSDVGCAGRGRRVDGLQCGRSKSVQKGLGENMAHRDEKLEGAAHDSLRKHTEREDACWCLPFFLLRWRAFFSAHADLPALRHLPCATLRGARWHSSCVLQLVSLIFGAES